MPALSFGLSANKPPSGPAKPPQKRKAVFQSEDVEEEEEDGEDAFGSLQRGAKSKIASASSNHQDSTRPTKSPKLSANDSSRSAVAGAAAASKYGNLSALRNAKLQDDEASKLDASVYDYDEVYETFHTDKEKKRPQETGEPSVPKYMTSLLASAEVRKRDQLRAREKLLQKERENEGDEFADKEKFVTGGYKKQQEEMRQMEEEEKKREEEEEKRRKEGGGMTAFHKAVLRKDEEREKAVEQAADDVRLKRERGEMNTDDDTAAAAAAENEPREEDENKIAASFNEKGARIVMNDEGEVVDKRQLLTAGLNVAPKKPGADAPQRKNETSKPQEWQRSAKAQDARMSQRERQTRMIERQIEEMAEKQKEADAEEEKERQDKNKTKITETDKLSAKERYLQRKREREEAAKAGKGG